MARSLNKVELIGNLTRDPELRYTPAGTAVCTFGLATNRQWVTESGEKKEEAEFHRIVAWNKLAELCSQLLTKGRKVYVEGRLQTRKWVGQDQVERSTVEIVITDMIILDSRVAVSPKEEELEIPDSFDEEIPVEEEQITVTSTTQSQPTEDNSKKKLDKKIKGKSDQSEASNISSDDEGSKDEDEEDIPF